MQERLAIRPQLPNNPRWGGHLDVLGSIPEEYRDTVLEQCGRKRYLKRQILWNQGDKAGYVAFLVEGKAMSTYHSPNGKVGITGFWFAGDILGAADLGQPHQRQMTVKCLEDTLVYTLPMERFYEVTRRFPELSQTIIKALSIRLRWMAHLAITLETQMTFSRVCSMLLALQDSFGQHTDAGILIDLNLSHEDLGAMVGVTRQFINTTLHDLRRRRLIELKQRKIIITNLKELEALAYET